MARSRFAQLILPFVPHQTTPAPHVSPELLQEAPGPEIEFVRIRRARRYILRVRPDGTVRVTVPRGGSRREAEAFVQKHREWVEKERRRSHEVHAPREWRHGSEILMRGVPVRISVSGESDEGVVSIAYGDRTLRSRTTGSVRDAIEQDLRRLARSELPPRLRELAALHNLQPGEITIRNQRSRWGSCSPDGNVALNFRLLQMPPHIRDYVMIHELMHLRQQNHSRRFWRLVAAAYPGFREAERWLKTMGQSFF
jgi:hypothetical protein